MKNKDESFNDMIKKVIQKLFTTSFPSDFEFQKALINVIVRCFHTPSKKIDHYAKSTVIITQLLDQLNANFDFSTFVQNFDLNKKDRKAFLIAIVQGLYYGDILISNLIKQKENLEYFFIQIMAENISNRSLKRILISLSLDKTLRLVCFIYQNYREGSFTLLHELGKIYTRKFPIGQMLHGLSQRYFDVKKLSEILQNQTVNADQTESQVLSKLDEFAHSQIAEFKELFSELIPLVVNSPLFIFHEIEKFKQSISKGTYQPLQKELDEGNAKATLKSQNLRHLFQSFFLNPPTLEQCTELLQLFGFYDHAPLMPHQKDFCKDNTLIEKMKMLIKIFSDASIMITLKAEDFDFYFVFLQTLVAQLQILKHPEEYLNEMERFLLAMPTRGKHLEDLPGLISSVRGFHRLISLIKLKLKNRIALRNYPLFVFDQSEEAIFKKNQRFINKLNRIYQCSIVHLSQHDVLMLSKKLDIENLIDTTKKGFFGYGGMRNSIFLLTPVLKHLFVENKNAQEMVNADASLLHSLFNRYVLGGMSTDIPAGDTIFMIDDDMEIPEANIFSHLLLSKDSRKINLTSMGFHVGRETKHKNQYPPLKMILENPIETFKFNFWSEKIISAGMSEYISNPRICVNLPFGGEELLIFYDITSNLFFRASYHLGGNRLPKNLWPSHYIVGIEQHLTKYIPYSLHLSMITSIAPPFKDRYQRNIYPWSDKDIEHPLLCLRDSFKIISNEENRKEMQKRFWKNVRILFDPMNHEKMVFKSDLQNLLETPVEEILHQYQMNSKLNSLEKKSLTEIGNIYKFYQEDANYLCEFGSTLLKCLENPNTSEIELVKNTIESKHKIQFQDFPLTFGFYLMTKALGAAEFNQELKRILTKTK